MGDIPIKTDADNKMIFIRDVLAKPKGEGEPKSRMPA